MLRRSGAESLARLQTLSLRGSAKAGRIKQLEEVAKLKVLRMLDLGGNALAAPDVHRQRLPQFLKALDDAVRYLDERSVPLGLTDRTKLATLVESATGTKFVSRFGTGGPRPQRTGAVCSAPQEASFGIFGTAACTLHSAPHVCGWLARHCCITAACSRVRGAHVPRAASARRARRGAGRADADARFDTATADGLEAEGVALQVRLSI